MNTIVSVSLPSDLLARLDRALQQAPASDVIPKSKTRRRSALIQHLFQCWLSETSGDAPLELAPVPEPTSKKPKPTNEEIRTRAYKVLDDNEGCWTHVDVVRAKLRDMGISFRELKDELVLMVNDGLIESERRTRGYRSEPGTYYLKRMAGSDD